MFPPQTLDMFVALCRERNYPMLRLDGSTSITKRQKLVKQFCDQTQDQFVFLLSSKARLDIQPHGTLAQHRWSWHHNDCIAVLTHIWHMAGRPQCSLMLCCYTCRLAGVD